MLPIVSLLRQYFRHSIHQTVVIAVPLLFLKYFLRLVFTPLSDSNTCIRSNSISNYRMPINFQYGMAITKINITKQIDLALYTLIKSFVFIIPNENINR